MQNLPVDSDGYLTDEIFFVSPDITAPPKKRFSWSKKTNADSVDAGVDGTTGDFADQFIAWAAHRYDAKLTRADYTTLMGYDEVGNTIQLDGKEIMIGTPADFEPGSRFGLIEPGTGWEPRHRA